MKYQIVGETTFTDKVETEHELTWIMQHELQRYLLDNIRVQIVE